jgi:excisionase family DNA binding protein
VESRPADPEAGPVASTSAAPAADAAGAEHSGPDAEPSAVADLGGRLDLPRGRSARGRSGAAAEAGAAVEAAEEAGEYAAARYAAEVQLHPAADPVGAVLRQRAAVVSRPDDLLGGDRLLMPAEVARMFRVDAKTVTRWAKAGRIGSIRTLGGHRRFWESEVRALLEVSP